MATLKICDICKSKDKKAHSEINLRPDTYGTTHDEYEIGLGGMDYCIDCLIKKITYNYGSEMAPKELVKCYRCNDEEGV